MQYKKRINSGPWAKKDVDYKDGDIITIANEGHTDDSGDYGPREVFLIKLGNEEEKNMAFNQTSINGLIDAYGEESKNWIGKPVKITLVNQNVAGKFLKVAYVSHPDALLTEDGFVLPKTSKDLGGEIPF